MACILCAGFGGLKGELDSACGDGEGDGQVEKLAALATQKMGGVSVSGDAGLRMAFNREITKVKRSGATYVVRLGEVRVGLARHRALLFKVRRRGPRRRLCEFDWLWSLVLLANRLARYHK